MVKRTIILVQEAVGENEIIQMEAFEIVERHMLHSSLVFFFFLFLLVLSRMWF